MSGVSEPRFARALCVTVMSVGAALAGVGMLGVVAPLGLLDLGRSLLSPPGLYAIALIRVVFGLLLLWAAPLSRMPRVLRIIGAFILINGVVTPFIGVKRAEALLDWFSNQGPLFVRVVATLSIALGAFLVYVVIPRRRSSSNKALEQTRDG